MHLARKTHIKNNRCMVIHTDTYSKHRIGIDREIKSEAQTQKNKSGEESVSWERKNIPNPVTGSSNKTTGHVRKSFTPIETRCFSPPLAPRMSESPTRVFLHACRPIISMTLFTYVHFRCVVRWVNSIQDVTNETCSIRWLLSQSCGKFRSA